MSLPVGITRLYRITIDDGLRCLEYIPYAVKAINWLRSYWKNADPFKRYRIIQAPVELLPLALPMVVGYSGQILSSGIGAPILLGQLSVTAILMMVSGLLLSQIGKGRFLRRVREAWILPDPIIAFDCVHCNYRHGEFAHSTHPPKRCKTCRTSWKNEWADYRKRPVVEMYMDDFYPRMTW